MRIFRPGRARESWSDAECERLKRHGIAIAPIPWLSTCHTNMNVKQIRARTRTRAQQAYTQIRLRAATRVVVRAPIQRRPTRSASNESKCEKIIGWRNERIRPSKRRNTSTLRSIARSHTQPHAAHTHTHVGPSHAHTYSDAHCVCAYNAFKRFEIQTEPYTHRSRTENGWEQKKGAQQ